MSEHNQECREILGKEIAPGPAEKKQEHSDAKYNAENICWKNLGVREDILPARTMQRSDLPCSPKKRKLQDAAWRFLENVLRCFVDLRFQLVHRAVIFDQKIVINLVNF